MAELTIESAVWQRLSDPAEEERKHTLLAEEPESAQRSYGAAEDEPTRTAGRTLRESLSETVRRVELVTSAPTLS